MRQSRCAARIERPGATLFTVHDATETTSNRTILAPMTILRGTNGIRAVKQIVFICSTWLRHFCIATVNITGIERQCLRQTTTTRCKAEGDVIGQLQLALRHLILHQIDVCRREVLAGRFVGYERDLDEASVVKGRDALGRATRRVAYELSQLVNVRRSGRRRQW